MDIMWMNMESVPAGQERAADEKTEKAAVRSPEGRGRPLSLCRNFCDPLQMLFAAHVADGQLEDSDRIHHLRLKGPVLLPGVVFHEQGRPWIFSSGSSTMDAVPFPMMLKNRAP